MPIGSGGPQDSQQGQPVPSASTTVAAGKEATESSQQTLSEKPLATVKLPSAASTPAQAANTPAAPPPPTESKPDVAAALAPPAVTSGQGTQNQTIQAPSAPRSGRIMPAIPLKSPAMKPASPSVNGSSKPKMNGVPPAAHASTKPSVARPAIAANKSLDAANQEAAAAVAAAMAKLPPAPGQKKQQPDGDKAIDNLARKVNEMRTMESNRTSKPNGSGIHAGNHRGGRGNARGGRQSNDTTKKIEVPSTDYDFATANAKFNKQDLVKEAIASGSPIEAGGANDVPSGSSINGSRKNSESVIIPPGPGYDKTSSFFDNISSETKDRLEGTSGGGREFRSEEQRRNVETFGQGSIDSGYRGGYRGRGRGRGYGRGRAGYGGRGSYGARGGGARTGRAVASTET